MDEETFPIEKKNEKKYMGGPRTTELGQNKKYSHFQKNPQISRFILKSNFEH